jgi:radical SAM superfamily enzyme YgiQ (UPF0313 family)
MKFKTLLLYPKLGSADTLITYPPLSLLYAASESIKKGKNISILDLRLYNDYLEAIKKNIDPDTKIVGISVMTGRPIKYALEISRFLKDNYKLSIVWGGVHPTLLPKETLKEESIDYIVAGYGSRAIFKLIDVLEKDSSLDQVPNLYYKKNGKILFTNFLKEHELIPYYDIPYHLVDMDKYFSRTLGKRDVPIFTSLGCPYSCTFCVAPVLYKNINNKWIGLDVDSIISHIEMLASSYQIDALTVFDDESFFQIERMRDFFQKLISSGLSKKIKINFRGARINELDKMNDEDIALMAEAGVNYIMIGVESGSEKVLDSMKKGFSPQAIRRVNKKLALYPKIKPHYNFFVGTPGETVEDLKATRDLLLDLLKDNPSCYLGFGSDWKPIPGSEMTSLAEKEFGLKIPNTLSGWAEVDSFDADYPIRHAWYSDEYERMVRLLQCSAGIIDRKFYREFITDKRFFIKLLAVAVLLYRPFILWRVKHSFSRFLIEFKIRDWLIKHFIVKL